MIETLCSAIKHFVEHDEPNEKGSTKRDHLEQAGVVVEDPEIPPAGEHIWEWFWDLDRSRQPSVSGYAPLSNLEILAWCVLTGNRLEPWELQVIKALDAERCS